MLVFEIDISETKERVNLVLCDVVCKQYFEKDPPYLYESCTFSET